MEDGRSDPSIRSPLLFVVAYDSYDASVSILIMVVLKFNLAKSMELIQPCE